VIQIKSCLIEKQTTHLNIEQRSLIGSQT